ncbi:MAG: hypothetical protein ABR587_09820, partial [Candidatus Binatia bacterium]
GASVDPACLTKGETKFGESFSTAESKTGVDCNGLDVTTRTIVEDTVADVSTAAPVPVGGGVCVSSVHKSAGKFASSLLGAW